MDQSVDIVDLHRRAVGAFDERVRGIPAGAWSGATPCREWDVRALVNHVVMENLWIAPLVGGARVEDVSHIPDGDLLGDDPVAAWERSAAEALEATSLTSLDDTVHLSFGDVPASEYLWQLTADALVHAWDLARATGQDETFDPELVSAVAEWFTGNEEAYRAAGAIGPAVAYDGDDPTRRLLARTGRDPSPA